MDTEIEETSAAAEHTVASTLYNYVFHGIPFLQSQEIKWTSPATEHTDIKATSSPAEHIHSKSSSSDAESMEIIPSRPHTFLHPPMDPLLLPPMNPWLLRMDPLMDGTSATEIMGSLSLRRMDPLIDETSATEITGSLSPPMDPLMDETSSTEITGSLSPPMDPLMYETSATEFTAHAEITESRERKHRPNDYIFRVPEHIRERGKNPLAEQLYFEPKLVSIGPYYYGEPKLKRMQDLKIRSIEEIQDISLRRKDVIVLALPDERVINPEFLRQFMVSGRKAKAYYKEPFVGHGDDKFVEMLILDSCFIIRTIIAFSQQTLSMSFYDAHIQEVRSDLLLLDNQIPLFFIKEVYEWFFSKDKKLRHLYTYLEPFICLDMPWRINGDAKSREATHLLNLYWLYSLPPQMNKRDLASSGRYHSETENSNSSEIDLSNNALMVIANATDLQQMAGIKFEQFKDRGNLDVIFSNGIIRMPRLKIDSRQITLLRNLVVFETCKTARRRIISYYMKLMDALIDSENDVKLLQKCGVIYNKLSSHEMAATFFNDIGDFCFTDDNANPFADLYKDVQEYYDSRWHRRLASLRHNYFSSPWTGISVVAAVILLFLAVLQAFYTIYGYQHQKN